MESVSNNGEEPASWDELYNIDLMPSELFFKFRKEVEGIRVGLNLEFYNAPSNEFQTKFVLKPLSPARKWKLMYEPLHHDVRLVSKKIPVTKYLNLQTRKWKTYPKSESWTTCPIHKCTDMTLSKSEISQTRKFHNKLEIPLHNPGKLIFHKCT
ncbi:hypothetical protein MKW94_025054 [Papaver nudicaule]|uniref:DUF7781 domain-containing protein n=1 Tax=Papaver nudicaule TaxID=74823 RepID=A0AA41S4R7_PAPNU|nr:hypothetical protein [Papaver nudicaule]